MRGPIGLLVAVKENHVQPPCVKVLLIGKLSVNVAVSMIAELRAWLRMSRSAHNRLLSP